MSSSSRGRGRGGGGGGKSAQYSRRNSNQNWVIKSPIDQQGSSPSLNSNENHQPVRRKVQKSISELVREPYRNPIDPNVEEPNSDFIRKDQEQVSQDSGKNLEFSQEPIRKNRRNSKRVSRNIGEKKSEDQGSSREVVGVLNSCVEEKVEESGLGDDVDDVWRRMEELQLGAEEPELSNEQLRINDQAQEDELLVLESIFGDNVFILDRRNGLRYFQVHVHIEVPDELTLSVNLSSSSALGKPDDTSSEFSYSLKVEHLPPIVLTCLLPKSYPSHLAPHFTISVQWLNSANISSLCSMLDSIWKEQLGQEVLYQWVEWHRHWRLVLLFNPFFSYIIHLLHPTILLQDMDDEYAKLIRRMNPPRVVIDNDSCEDATIIQVDSVNKHGILLRVVQVLTDLNLVITKAYISSDGGWFMDVFNVTDQVGNKVRDEEIITYIQKTLENDEVLLPSLRGTVGLMPSEKHTSIELSGTDRPGLFSEVCAVLADLHCNVVNAAIWTHNARAAAVVHVVDDVTDCAIEDPKRLATIKKLLRNVLKGNNDLKTAKMTLSPPGFTHRERRLHQIMFDDRDYVKVKRTEQGNIEDLKSGPSITVYDCSEKDYTVITMRSRDRPKLLFDIVCTLTDMQYVVFHGVVHTGKNEAYQEFYIRHVDGLPISSEAERERVILCLEAAIERRTSECLELELFTEDRLGLLSDITRIFRENSLCIKRAEISTEAGKAKDIFYVTDVTGNPVEQKTVDSIREQVGPNMLHVKWNPCHSAKLPEEGTISYLFGSLFKVRTLQNLKLIGPYT